MASKKKTEQKYQANRTFSTGRRMVSQGDIVTGDDPILKGREALFDRLEYVPVETATAAPGEKRTVSRPSTKKDA